LSQTTFVPRTPSTAELANPARLRGLRAGQDGARSAGAAARRRHRDWITHASLRQRLTHRGEDPPAASRHGAPQTAYGSAATACRRSHLGMALEIMSPGAGVRDPRLVAPSAY
jgi:hypothetical protein